MKTIKCHLERSREILLLLICFMLFTGCEEDVNLTIVGGDTKIVIEGSIENGKPAVVIVTHNSPLSQTLDFYKILVTDAKVYMSNGIITDTLVFGIDSTASIPLVYKGSSIIGVVGQTYYLTVIADGKTYTAVTSIPAPVPFDSVWFKVEPNLDSLGFAWAHLSEPAGTGNAYRWFAKRASRDRRFLSPFGGTFDDKFIEGKSFDMFYDHADDPTDTINESSDLDYNYFKKTDTIYLKFCSIDYQAVKFYTTLEAALGTNGNPFASPVTVIGNINGGGLGIWAGFGAAYDTIMPTP